MGYVSIAILAITAFCLLTSFVLGFIRGFNRSLLRASLVIISAVLAFALRGVLADMILAVNIGDGNTIGDIFTLMFDLGVFPTDFLDLAYVLIKIIFSFVSFFILFALISFVTWALFFPLLKLAVGKGVRKRRALGSLVGLLQGCVVAFAFCAPLTGLVAEVEKMSHAQIDGQPVFELPAEINAVEYAQSPLGVFYSKTGGWFFDLLATSNAKDGSVVTIGDTVSVFTMVTYVSSVISDLTSGLDVLGDINSTPSQKIDAMRDVGDYLIKMGSSTSEMSGQAKKMLEDIISSSVEMMTPEGQEIDPALQEALNNFDLSQANLDSAGKALNGIATYIEKTDVQIGNNEPVTQTEIDDIVNGLADSNIIFSFISQGDVVDSVIDIENTEHKAMFEESIAK